MAGQQRAVPLKVPLQAGLAPDSKFEKSQQPVLQTALKVLSLPVRNLQDYRRPNVGIRSSGWNKRAPGVHDLLLGTNPDPMTDATITYTDSRTLPLPAPPSGEVRPVLLP